MATPTEEQTIRFMRGAVKYAAEKMGITPRQAGYRIKNLDPLTIMYAMEFEITKKKQKWEALQKYRKVKAYNPKKDGNIKKLEKEIGDPK